MEHCFRIALYMFFLIGYLKAKPVGSKDPRQDKNPLGKPLHFNMNDLGFGFLHQSIHCDHNVNFTTPTEVKVHFIETLTCFIEGLEHARSNCEDKDDRILDTLSTLDILGNDSEIQTTNSTACKWEGRNVSHLKFADFLNSFETFLQQLNYGPSSQKP